MRPPSDRPRTPCCACARRCASARSATRAGVSAAASRTLDLEPHRSAEVARQRLREFILRARGCARGAARIERQAHRGPFACQQYAVAGQLLAARPADPAPRRSPAIHVAVAGAAGRWCDRSPAPRRCGTVLGWRGRPPDRRASAGRTALPRGRTRRRRRVPRRPKGQHADQRHAKAGARIRRQRQIAPPENGGLIVQLHILGAESRAASRASSSARMQLIALVVGHAAA